MSKRPRKTRQMPLEDIEYVEKWAGELVAAIGKRKARLILDDYKAIAANTRLSKRDCEAAAQRQKALAKICVTVQLTRIN